MYSSTYFCYSSCVFAHIRFSGCASSVELKSKRGRDWEGMIVGYIQRQNWKSSQHCFYSLFDCFLDLFVFDFKVSE